MMVNFIRGLMVIQVTVLIIAIILLYHYIYNYVHIEPTVTTTAVASPKEPTFLEEVDCIVQSDESRWQSTEDLDNAIKDATQNLIKAMKASNIPNMALSVLGDAVFRHYGFKKNNKKSMHALVETWMSFEFEEFYSNKSTTAPKHTPVSMKNVHHIRVSTSTLFTLPTIEQLMKMLCRFEDMTIIPVNQPNICQGMMSTDFVTYCFFNTRNGAAFFFLTIENDDCTKAVDEQSIAAVRKVCDRFYPYCNFKVANVCDEDFLDLDTSITNVPMIPFYRYCLRNIRTAKKDDIPPKLNMLADRLSPYDTNIYESWFQEIVLCSNHKDNCDLGNRCMSPETKKHIYFRIMAASKLYDIECRQLFLQQGTNQ
ncbi:hypothetical protein ElyMa_002560500 [Elysia marginata]|uniref:Uncharacterized protein n=1 Tax=Elysia marginata TaxID=1093978 RepID=A0AAV4GXE6_9GAST|nr:hypothetical protein ElyMa_002560500 [Elysia marginata]